MPSEPSAATSCARGRARSRRAACRALRPTSGSGDDRDDEPVGRDDRVDAEQRQARRTVEDDRDRSAPSMRSSMRRSIGFAAAHAAQRDIGVGQLDRSRSADRGSASSVWRTALRMGYFSRRQDAVDGLSWWRATPSQSEAEAWLSRSTSRIAALGRGERGGEVDGGGGLADASLAVENGDDHGQSFRHSIHKPCGRGRRECVARYAVLQCERQRARAGAT